MLISFIFLWLLEVIDKFLIEYHQVNPFGMLMREGFFGLFLTSIFSFFENPFKEIKSVYDNKKDFYY